VRASPPKNCDSTANSNTADSAAHGHEHRRYRHGQSAGRRLLQHPRQRRRPGSMRGQKDRADGRARQVVEEPRSRIRPRRLAVEPPLKAGAHRDHDHEVGHDAEHVEPGSRAPICSHEHRQRCTTAHRAAIADGVTVGRSQSSTRTALSRSRSAANFTSSTWVRSDWLADTLVTVPIGRSLRGTSPFRCRS
jgi:hypothetical protein